MAKILILEDDPDRMKIFRLALEERHEIMHVETAQQAIDCLEFQVFDVVFLDHDLGGETYVSEANVNTGSEVARYMATGLGCTWYAMPIVIHSMNIPAAEKMEHKLRAAGYSNVHRISFTKLVTYLDDPGFIV
jgi:CheY-like chemotaxis protein